MEENQNINPEQITNPELINDELTADELTVDELTTDQSTTDESTISSEPVISPKYTQQEAFLRAAANRESIEIDKNILSNVANEANKNVNQYAAMAKHGVNYGSANRGGLNLQRYYNRDEFQKLGFNPFIDNESYYQANTTAWDDFRAAYQQSWNLAKQGFFSYYSGQTEYEKADAYEKYANIGTSQREGASRIFNNVVLNAGYTVGLLSSIIVEEVAIGLLTGGIGNIGKLGVTAAKVGTGVKKANALKRTVNAVKELKNLSNVDKARSLWQGTKNLGTATVKASTNFIPGAKTAELIYNWKHLGKLGKSAGQASFASFGAKAAHTFGTFYREGREVLLAYDEAQLESGMIYNSIMDELTMQYKQDNNGNLPSKEDLNAFHDIAYDRSMKGFTKNMAIIYGTNKISFGNMFNKLAPSLARKTAKGFQNSGGKIVKGFDGRSARAVYNKGILNIKGSAAEAWKGVKNYKSTLKAIPGFIGKNAWTYTRANVGEGIQEYFQEVIQHAEQTSAKDLYAKYKSGVRGVALNQAMEDMSFAENYGKAASHFWSGEGLEIFGTGAMMGFIAGPYSKFVGKVGQARSELWQYRNKKTRDARKAHMQKEYDILDKKVENFNKLSLDEKKNLYKYVELMGNQAQYDEEMKDAVDQNDDKKFYDVQDEALSEYLLSALQLGMLDNFESGLKDMLNLSEQEFTEAFADQLGLDPEQSLNLKKRATDILGSVTNIKEGYETLNNIFPEIYDFTNENPELFDGVSIDTLNDMRNKYISTLILNQRQLNRNLDRYQKLQQSLIGVDNPFRDVGAVSLSSLSNLVSNTTLAKELKLLETEINTIKQGRESAQQMVGTQKQVNEATKELKKKERLYKKLSEIYEVMQKFETQSKKYSQITGVQNIEQSGRVNLLKGTYLNYLVNKSKSVSAKVTGVKKVEGKPALLTIEYTEGEGKDKTKVTKEIEFVKDNILELQIDAGTESMTISKSAQAKIKSYLKEIAKEANTTVDESKFESFIRKFLDARLLKIEEIDIANVIEQLLLPEVYSEYIAKQLARAKDLNKYFDAILKYDLETFTEAAITNQFLAQLVNDHNIFLTADDVVELLTGQIPADLRLFDIKTLEQVNPGTERYIKALADIKEHVESTDEFKKERKAKEEAEKAAKAKTEEEVVAEEEEEAPASTEEITVKMITDDVPNNLNNIPKELKDLILKRITEFNEELTKSIDQITEPELKKLLAAQKLTIDTLSKDNEQMLRDAIDEYNNKASEKTAQSTEEKKEESAAKPKASESTATKPSQVSIADFTGEGYEQAHEYLKRLLDGGYALFKIKSTNDLMKIIGNQLFHLATVQVDGSSASRTKILLTQEQLAKFIPNILKAESQNTSFAITFDNVNTILDSTITTTTQGSVIDDFKFYMYPTEKSGIYQYPIIVDDKTYYVESEEIADFWSKDSKTALYSLDVTNLTEFNKTEATDTKALDELENELITLLNNLTIDNYYDTVKATQKLIIDYNLNSKNKEKVKETDALEALDLKLEQLKKTITIDNFKVSKDKVYQKTGISKTYTVKSINKKDKKVTFESIGDGKFMTLAEENLYQMREVKIDEEGTTADDVVETPMSEEANEKFEGTKNTTDTLTADQIKEAVDSVTGEENLEDLMDGLEEIC